ncbi:MAG: hypothetical protein Q7R92_04485 [bacterium]|nr:hypothetical protein [bacterium]
MKTLKFNRVKKINLTAVSMLAVSLAIAGAAQAATFEDNTLIRGEDGQIFVVRQNQRVKVSSLDDLRRNFRGKAIVNVDNRTLSEIKVRTSNSGRGSVQSANSGPGSIKNNSLIRTRDGKIFAIEQGERRQIRDMAELRREHAGQAVRNVDDAVLRRFPINLDDNPNSLFDNNRLIRDTKNRIFVVEDNGLRRIADLNEIRREHLGQAIHNVNDDILLANGVKLRGDGTVDDNSRQIRGLDDLVSGIKLRGDGTVDDNLPGRSGVDDLVNGVRLRGDGTVDDSPVGTRVSDDLVNGVNLRGDGTVDDNSAGSGGSSSGSGGDSGGRK